jgi:hypothetical protein
MITNDARLLHAADNRTQQTATAATAAAADESNSLSSQQP